MKKFLLIILLPLSGVFCQQAFWEIKDQMPYPVAGAESLVWGNKIYIIGGYSLDTQGNVKWIQTYDVSNNQWSDYTNMQYARYGLNAALKYDTVYCYGGVWDSTYSSTSVEKWDITFSAVSSVFDNHKYFKRIFSSGVIVGDNYYIIGGNPYLGLDSSWFPYIAEYNTISQSVTFELQDSTFGDELPEQQMLAVINNDIYIFGGVLNGLPSKTIYKFNTSLKELEKLDIQLSEPRAGGIAVKGMQENSIFLIGGYHEQSAALSSVEVFEFDGTNYSVSEYPGINIPRKQLMGENVNGIIYLFGGFDEKGDWVEEIEMLSTVVSANEAFEIENLDFNLNQNYPNPFNPSTKIIYTVPENDNSNGEKLHGDLSTSSNSPNNDANVSLTVYDVLGNEIKTLVNTQKKPGNYEVEFNADGIANGVYFYKLTVENSSISKRNSFSETKKMVLLK